MFRSFLAQNGSRLRTQSDEELCQRAASSHDPGAFHELFDRYWSRVFRLTLAIVKSEAEAEDVAQAVFIEVYGRAKEFDAAKGLFCNWLLRYATADCCAAAIDAYSNAALTARQRAER